MENTEFSIVKACVPVIHFKRRVGCSTKMYHYASFRFQLFQHFGVAFQAKNNIRSALLALHLYNYPSLVLKPKNAYHKSSPKWQWRKE